MAESVTLQLRKRVPNLPPPPVLLQGHLFLGDRCSVNISLEHIGKRSSSLDADF